MSVSLGEDWKDFFDLILVDNKKPLFQRSENPFFIMDESAKNFKGSVIDSS